jgi:electron transfer flavoprotein beta subunit
MSHAVVLVKQILDPELPADRFEIDEAARRPAAGIGPELLGPFEQSGLELALQLRDGGLVDRVTALAAGGPDAVEGLRKALSLRVDEVVHVLVEEDGTPDPAQTAVLIARAVARLDSAALAVAGRQAGDWDQAQVGYLVAEQLGWPCVGLVQQASGADGRLLVVRQSPLGEETIAVDPPAVLTVTNHETSRLRMARVPDVLAAGRAPVTEWTAADLGLDAGALEAARRVEVLELRKPEQGGSCELLEGETPEAVAALLVSRLVELKLVGG